MLFSTLVGTILKMPAVSRMRGYSLGVEHFLLHGQAGDDFVLGYAVDIVPVS